MDFPRICPARWLSDQNFGTNIPPHDFLYPFYMHSNYFRPWKWCNQSISKEFGSTIENEKGNYKISLDVQHFRPDDISVKVADNEIIVEGIHEERPDTHGYISRQFKRRYALPNHCPAENVTSTLSSDGILTIIAEKRSSIDMEKIVPIKMCGPQSRKAHIETTESKITSEITQESKESMKSSEDKSNNNKAQILLKEEHSRLLKPELLKERISDRNSEKTSKQVTDIMGMSENKDAMNTSGISNKTEKIRANKSLGSSERSLASTSEMCAMKGRSNLSKTLIEESSSSYKSSSSMSSTINTTGKFGECASDIISAELKEAAENL